MTLKMRLPKNALMPVAVAIAAFACGHSGEAVLPTQARFLSSSSGAIPKHVLTYAYDDMDAGGMGATAAQVQAFTDWAEERTQTPPGKAEHDCYPGAGRVSCQAVWYVKASVLYSQDTPDQYMLAQLNSEQLSEDAGFYHNSIRAETDRVFNKGPGLPKCSASILGPCYFPNISNANVINFVVGCLLQGGSGSKCDNQSFRGPAPGTELFDDNDPAICENINDIGIYFPGGSSTFTPVELGSEPICDRKLQSRTLAFLAALMYANGLQARAFLNGYQPLCGNKTCAYPAGDATYWTGGSVPALGATDEGSVCASATTPIVGFTGAIVLNDMAQLFNEAGSGYFVFLNYSTAVAGSPAQLRMRRYCDGIFWLGYSPNRSILWSNYSNGNRTPANANILAVYPEQQIVPTNPTVSMTDVTTSTLGYNGTGCIPGGNLDSSMGGGAHSLVVACGVGNNSMPAGVYVRQFRQCYSWARLVGAGQCAVVVNMTNQAVAVGGTRSRPWRYPNATLALDLGYNEMLVLSGRDVVTDRCSVVSGCPTGKGTDLDFGGAFNLYNTVVPSGDAVFLFHT